MAQNRPDKPNITLPDDFGGTQTPFDSELVENGYEPSIPQVVEGGNLNWFINGFFQNIKYVRAVLDYVRDTPIGKMFWINQNGQMDYIQPSVIATNTEYNTGTSTTVTPNVKQVTDSLATKQATITGGATSITSSNLTKNRALISNGSGKVGVSTTTSTELGYLSGVSSAIQTQLNSKATPSDITTAVDSLLSSLYPVGSIYMGTQSSCPLASLITGSTWTKVSGDKVLQTSSSIHSANSTIAAGLPNITGQFQAARDAAHDDTSDGAFYNKSQGNSVSNSGDKDWIVGFDASRSNSIYGNSDTVQPPAYVVNVWRRTA